MISNIPNTGYIHFVGIGGVGMSGIAKVLASEGYKISGSDLNQNTVTQELIDIGVAIYFNHHPSNIRQASAIVVSSAIQKNNPEILAAYKAGIPVIHRAKILAEMMRYRYSIAIAGTHGKTTTTAMITCIYIEAGLDPTFINGGLIKPDNINARLGHSHYLIAEADESDASFLDLKPEVAIITNIGKDHVNMYQGCFKNLQTAFIKFLYNLPLYGYAVICIDDPVIHKLLPRIERNITTYGFKKGADVQIIQYQQIATQGHFYVIRPNKKPMKIVINIPGRHNSLNAAAAVAVAMKEGIHDEVIIRALENFQGISRRFEFLGECKFESINGRSSTAILVDDYGHHPTEIDETIKTVRSVWSEKKLIMLFQPHRFTRTRDLYVNFIKVLSKVDVLLVLNIYSSNEIPILGIDSLALCSSIRRMGKIDPILVNHPSQISIILSSVLQGKDNLILIQGAGDISDIIRNLLHIKFCPVY